MTIDALLFDLDGTIVDTDDLHYRAYKKLLRRFGRDLHEDEYWATVQGKPNELAMQDLFPDIHLDNRRALAEEKERDFRSSVEAVRPKRGLAELLGWACLQAIPTGLVTGAPRLNAELMLEALGLQESFKVVVLADELSNTKPHPLPYLTALQRLGVSASKVIAFEDSMTGIRSAAAAGIETVCMRTRLQEAQVRNAGARMVIEDFLDPALWRRLDRAT